MSIKVTINGTDFIINETFESIEGAFSNNLNALMTAIAAAIAGTLASPTFTGTVVLPSTTSIGAVSSTEISYVDGVTSAIQTQLNAKSATASPNFTGTVGFPAYTLSTLPAVDVNGVIIVTDANSGDGTVAFGKDTSWIDVKTGVAVA